MSAQAADALLGGVINNTGVIEANSLVSHGGVVSLEASDSVKLAGSIDVSGATTGGTVMVNAASITLAGAAVNATGPSGGGTIAIGNSAASCGQHGRGLEPRCLGHRSPARAARSR